MRYRLIPARGQPSRVFEGTVRGAIWEAEDIWADLGCQVLVCEAPLDGVVREVELVGTPEEPKSKRRER